VITVGYCRPRNIAAWRDTVREQPAKLVFHFVLNQRNSFTIQTVQRTRKHFPVCS
jgi:hypothetical protein